VTKTTILIEIGTRKKLREIGRKNQTYDDLINELIVSKVNNSNSPHYQLVRLHHGNEFDGEKP